MRRFFIEKIEKPSVRIRGEEARHMLRVLRMETGDRFILFDGSGYDYPCEIESVGPDDLVARVGGGTPNQQEPAVQITLYQAMLKKDNMDLVLQKTTELGIAGFVPVIASRCVKRPEDPGKIQEKFERTVREAAKQCGRSRMPSIGAMTELKNLKDAISRHQAVFLAYENAEVPIKTRLKNGCFTDVGLIIGPEGGFEPDEARMLMHLGAMDCSLGKLILRAETAAIAAVSMILYENMEIQ